MSGVALAGFGFALMLALAALRAPVALAMILVGAAGYLALAPLPAFLSFAETTGYYVFASYSTTVIPLFVLLGALAERTGFARDLFLAAGAMVGHRPGGLPMALVGACAGFGAICGSAVATTATFTRAALPELRHAGVDPGLATGVLAVGGTLGILIPPSVILILYAISTEQNIVKLFAAAMGPGLLAAVSYVVVIALLARRNPALAPAAARVAWPERMVALGRVWPVLLIAVIVLGGIYGGLFTPTEGAGVGVVATLLIGLLTRRLDLTGFIDSLRATAQTTGMIFAILLGAEMFNAFLALSQLPTALAGWVSGSGLPAWMVVAALLLIYLALGALMDEIAMLLLTLPVFFPVVMALDLRMDPDSTAIWFGVLVLVTVGVGLTAPPVGLNVFVVGAIARDVPLRTIYRGVAPFILADLLRLALIFAFPALVLGPVAWLG